MEPLIQIASAGLVGLVLGSTIVRNYLRRERVRGALGTAALGSTLVFMGSSPQVATAAIASALVGVLVELFVGSRLSSAHKGTDATAAPVPSATSGRDLS